MHRQKVIDQLNIIKHNRKLSRLVAALLLLLFLLFLLFNLFACSRRADVEAKEIEHNIKNIKQIQKVDVAVIESAVDALDAASGASREDSIRIKYRRMFASSIIIGDSLTEGLIAYNWLSEGNVMANIGGSILTSGDAFRTAAAAQPRYIFLAFGMNDMGNYCCDANAFVADYKALIQEMINASPNTRILVNSISTPTQEAQADNGSIAHYQEFNKAIAKMCKELKLVYIDITDILPNHPEMYAGDGIHANSDYYPLWMDRMAEKAGIQ